MYALQPDRTTGPLRGGALHQGESQHQTRVFFRRSAGAAHRSADWCTCWNARRAMVPCLASADARHRYTWPDAFCRCHRSLPQRLPTQIERIARATSTVASTRLISIPGRGWWRLRHVSSDRFTGAAVSHLLRNVYPTPCPGLAHASVRPRTVNSPQ